MIVKKLLILHLTSSYGGAEQITISLLEGLCKKWDIILASNDFTPFCQKIPYGVLMHLVPCSSFFPNKYLELLRQIYHIRKVLIEKRPDIVLGVMHYSAFLVTTASRLLWPKQRPKIVSGLHGPTIPALNTILKRRKQFYRFSALLLCRWSDIIVVPSRGMKNELCSSFSVPSEKVFQISNGISLDKAEKNTSQFLSKHTSEVPPIIAWCGRLVEEKEPDMLLAALGGLKSMEWELLIIGDGPLMSSLKRMASEFSIEKRVTFLGYQSDVSLYLNKADIFVHTCLFEGFGLAILEAMVSGCTVIAKNCPYGPAEILEDGKTGFLFNNIEELKRILSNIMSDPDCGRKIALNGQISLKKYDLGRMIQTYHKLFLSCLTDESEP